MRKNFFRKSKGAAAAEKSDYLRKEAGSLLEDEDFLGTYKPRTQETRQTYEVMLSFIQDAIGDQVFKYLLNIFF